MKGAVWRCLPRSYMPTANNNYSICISSDVNISVLPFESSKPKSTESEGVLKGKIFEVAVLRAVSGFTFSRF